MRGERVLITGGGGQLASDLELLLAGESTVQAPARARLDVTDDEALARAIEGFQPTVIVNCAAFHNVEVCEQEEDRSFEVNARAVKRMAQRSSDAGARLVHLSTNYVFDGRREAPYSEEDRPNPRSIYALSKLAGEYAALAYANDALVVRGAGLYGLHGSASKGGNFVTRMLARAESGEPIRMVADQRLSPTFTADLAAGILDALDAGVSGLVHLTSGGECSWHDFTVSIFDLAGVDTPVDAVSTVRRPGAADRPLNGVLACAAAERAGLRPLPHWRDGLADYLRRAGLAARAAA